MRVGLSYTFYPDQSWCAIDIWFCNAGAVGVLHVLQLQLRILVAEWGTSNDHVSYVIPNLIEDAKATQVQKWYSVTIASARPRNRPSGGRGWPVNQGCLWLCCDVPSPCMHTPCAWRVRARVAKLTKRAHRSSRALQAQLVYNWDLIGPFAAPARAAPPAVPAVGRAAACLRVLTVCWPCACPPRQPYLLSAVPQLVYVGMMGVRKGFDIFIDVVCQAARGVEASDGNQKGRLGAHVFAEKDHTWIAKARACTSPVDWVFHGTMPSVRLWQTIRSVKGMLLFTSRHENLPMVPVEAGFSGVPTLAINSGGLQEVLANRKEVVLANKQQMVARLATILADGGKSATTPLLTERVHKAGETWRDALRQMAVMHAMDRRPRHHLPVHPTQSNTFDQGVSSNRMHKGPFHDFVSVTTRTPPCRVGPRHVRRSELNRGGHQSRGQR